MDYGDTGAPDAVAGDIAAQVQLVVERLPRGGLVSLSTEEKRALLLVPPTTGLGWGAQYTSRQIRFG